MDTPPKGPPARYIVVVDGLLSARVNGALQHVSCAAVGSQTLLLCGESTRSDVYDVLRALGDLGVAVTAVRPVTEAS